jgi:hypothetical protein
MKNSLVCQTCIVHPILWVLPFSECPEWTKLFKMNCYVGYLKEYLLGKLKIDRFESSRSNKAGALHGGSVKIWILGIGGVSIPFVG